MVLNLLRDLNPTHIAVAFDVSRKTFRSEKFPEYKATRSKTPDEFRSQMELLHEIIEALGITHIEREGYEADDVIATLAKQAVAEGFQVEICSGDRDSFQLVSPQVTVLYPRKGVSDLAVMTPEAVFEKYGLTPEQYPDFAALRGDPSDNLPSIPGVGEKTATKWIAEFGSLKALIAQVDQVPGKVGTALREHVPQVLLNRELTQLDHHVPLSAKLSELARREVDHPRIRELFNLLEFRTLLQRLPKSESSAASEAPTEKFKQSGTIDELDDSLVAIFAAEELSHCGLAQGTLAFVVNYEEFSKWISTSRAPKIFFDGKALLRNLGAPIMGVHGDIALMAYLLNPGARSPDFSEVVAKYLQKNVSTEQSSAPELTIELDFAGGPDGSGGQLAENARDMLALFPLLQNECAAAGLQTVLEEIEIPTLALLAQMEARGIAIDEDAAEALEKYFHEQAESAAESAFASVGHEFNLASPKQLQEVLFNELKLPKTKKIKTGFTTDADALNWLLETTAHPVLAAILRSRDVTKLKSVVEGLRRSLAVDGRVHTTFQQMVTATGRLSSTDPNLQNIPIRTEEGRRIRNLFIPGDGFVSLMTADYSQIELRIMAHLSEDAGLLKAFAKGEDLHTTVGAEVFGVKPEEVDIEMRRTVKAMSYGLAYGLSAFGLSQQLDISPSQAQELMDKYFTRFGGIREYLRSVVVEARAKGFTETIFGRKRYLPDLHSDNRMRREMAERMALNAPIQGSAADIMKIAMLAVNSRIEAKKFRSRILLQVHDELVLEIAPGEAEEIKALVREEMGGAYPLKAPLAVNIGSGATWDSAAH